jgi:hypothetical protein
MWRLWLKPMSRENWMIYRGPGFLAVVWFGSTPTPSSPLSRQQVLSLPVCDGWRDGEGMGRGAKSHDCEKALPSINHTILSAQTVLAGLLFLFVFLGQWKKRCSIYLLFSKVLANSGGGGGAGRWHKELNLFILEYLRPWAWVYWFNPL